MHIILLREFIFLLRPAYTLYIQLFPQPAGKALPCCFPHSLNRPWTLILGSGMISLLEPRGCRAEMEERCVTGSTLELKLARLLGEACQSLCEACADLG